MKTVKELAEEIGVTTQAVRDEIRKQNIQPVPQNKVQSKAQSKSKRTLFYSEEDASRIISAFSERRKTKQDNKVCSINKASDETFFATLLNEIEVKNRQIEALQDQNAKLAETIKSLTDNNAQLQTSLQAAQALHAGTIQQITQKNDLQPAAPKWYEFWKKWG